MTLLKDTCILKKINKFAISLFLILTALCFADDDNAKTVKLIDYFSPDNILEFANYLYGNGDYIRAAGEYQRYLFLMPESENSDSIYYQIIKSYSLGKDYQRCDQLLNNFSKRYPSSLRLTDIALYKSIVKFQQRYYKESLDMAQGYSGSNITLKNIIAVMDYLYLSDFNEAQDLSCSYAEPYLTSEMITPANEYSGTLTQLCEKITQADSLVYKSRFHAGLYSSIIPGMGKVYCGRSADGFFSLLVVSLTVWQAYDGFNDKGLKSSKGWIFGTLGTGFYLGNIYGSIIAAKLYNTKIRDNFLQGLQIEISLP